MKWILVFAALAGSGPEQDLKQEVERLKKRIAALEAQNETLRGEILRLARQNFELRQALKSRRGSEAGPIEGGSLPKNGDAPVAGPDKPIHAKVQFVDANAGFLLLNKGKAAGIQVGYRFEIVRKVFKSGVKEPEVQRIGVGRVEKFLGANQDHAKLTLVEGKIADVRYDDDAVAYRKVAEKAPRSSDKEGDYKIVGRTGDVYMLSYGAIHGAAQSQIVYLYRDKKLIVKFRLDSVERTYSIARVIDGTRQGEFAVGDKISVREEKSLAVGRLIRIHPQAGTWVDVGTEHGVRVGTRMKVTRKGTTVGELILTKVERYWSTAKLGAGTKLDDLRRNDFVEEIP